MSCARPRRDCRLESINFQAGNFNADFGRSIGGLITAEARTPSKKGFHGDVDLNLVDSSALIEAPLGETRVRRPRPRDNSALIEAPLGESWSFALSARRSNIDVILPAVFSLILGAEDAVSFTLAPGRALVGSLESTRGGAGSSCAQHCGHTRWGSEHPASTSTAHVDRRVRVAR